MKNGKIVNFILEISQVFLVFLGVYSAVMCATLSLSLPVNRTVATLVLLSAAFLFYGLFTVLETFRRGKFYGMLGITAFVILVILRFRIVLLKGAITIINTYLKEFMNYTQSSITLLSSKGFAGESAGLEYCTTLVTILVAGYLIALISSCFYRKRRSSVYMGATILFFLVPVSVGKIGYFSNVITYIFASMAVVGTRFLRSDTTDKRMRQKLSLVLTGVGVAAGLVTWLFLPPQRYDANMDQIVEIKNSALALTTWEKEDLMTWFRGYFSGDVMEYGKIGKKNSVKRSGKKLLKISGDFDTNHGLYLKGYTGAVYSDNRWRQIKDEDGQFEKERDQLAADGLSVDNWHTVLRNQIGDSQTTGNDKLWSSGKLTIRNLAFGYGNYIIPYFPTTSFFSTGGRMENTVPGIQYETEYFPFLCTELKNGVAANSYRLAANEFWVNSQANRERLENFAKKYYTSVPEEVSGIVDQYKNYLNSQNGLLDQYNQGTASLYQIIEETRNFIMNDTKYTLSPGKTPGDEDAVQYFLVSNKKGYSNHYATAAAVLLRSIGIPARYAEGVYISKEKLADVRNVTTEIEVTDKNLHAWAEVYQENYGFVPFEFTPGIGEEDAEESQVTEKDDNNNGTNQGQNQGGADAASPQLPTPTPEDNEMEFENIETDNYNHDKDEEEAEAAKPEPEAKKDKTKKEASGGMVWWKVLLWILLGLVLFAVAAEGQRRLRFLIFEKNIKKKKHGRQIIIYYRHLEPVLNHAGIRYRGQSVEEFAEMISQTYGMKQEEAYEFVSIVFCASFSVKVFDREEMLRFWKLCRLIRHKIYAGQRGIKKLYYMYVYCL